MTEDRIAEIRARHEEGMRAGADEDRAYLLAEVERLHKAHQAACEGGDLLRAENARLRAQVAEYFREPATHPVEREE